MFIWLTAFSVSFLLCFFFFISIFLLDVFVRCGDHAPLYNLFNIILKNLGMFNVNSFCHLHSFFARCFYSIVEFFVLRKQKRNKLPTTTTLCFYFDFPLNLNFVKLTLLYEIDIDTLTGSILAK